MSSATFECQQCHRQYPARAGKLHCSKQCRKQHSVATKQERGRNLWNVLGDYRFPPEMESQATAFDDNQRVQWAITQSAPPGAVAYRLGCPRPGFLSPDELKLRWFPSPTQRRPCIFRLDPFEDPKVPYPGMYAVAYYDAAFQLCCSPQLRVSIPFWHPMIRWFHGDLGLVLGPGRR